MRKFWIGLVCSVVFSCLGLALADETLPPLKLGNGQTATQDTNGQTVQVSVSGIQATVYFTEISSLRVTGYAARTSTGTSAGTVTVSWLNEGKSVVLNLSALAPDQCFGMEGGETDKRTSLDKQLEP